MRTMVCILILGAALTTPAQDTITLLDCHRAVQENAPRNEDRDLISRIGALKVENGSTRWYPSLDLNGKLSYQSDVITLEVDDTPIPVEFPTVPNDQYGFNLDINQTIYDGGFTRQKKKYEHAATAAELQQVEVDLHGLKAKVNQFYFAILVLQENHKNLEIHMDNLVKKRAVMQSARREGTLLEAELKVIDVEILKIEKSRVELAARKKALLGALNVLCGPVIIDDAILKVPDLEPLVTEADNRPEIRWFELKDASMQAGKELLSKQRMPLLYAFGQTGYGNPGYNMMSGEWDFYYMVGAGFRWNIWDWNRSRRDRQVIENQRQILRNQRSTFDREVEALLAQEEASMEQYRKSMVLEEQVLTLQEEIAEHAATQLANGTITVTEFITELNKASMTRISLATQQVRLMQSIANYLTIQGNL